MSYHHEHHRDHGHRRHHRGVLGQLFNDLGNALQSFGYAVGDFFKIVVFGLFALGALVAAGFLAVGGLVGGLLIGAIKGGLKGASAGLDAAGSMIDQMWDQRPWHGHGHGGHGCDVDGRRQHGVECDPAVGAQDRALHAAAGHSVAQRPAAAEVELARMAAAASRTRRVATPNTRPRPAKTSAPRTQQAPAKADKGLE